MLKPDLIEFKPKTLAKSEEVNYNFDQMKNYVFGTANELQALVNSAVANLNLQLTQAVFTGKIEMYAGEASNIPEGWSLCDGGELDREEYKNLYNVIGIKYGAGNGVTTFNVPNYIGKFLEGGTKAGIVKEAGLPNVIGQFGSTCRGSNTNATCTGPFSRVDGSGWGPELNGTSQYAHVNFDLSKANPLFGKSNTVQPSSVTVLYIIKT